MCDSAQLLQLLGLDGPVPRLDEAMTHPSWVNEHAGATDYQRLEFLGDAVLGLCVTEMLLDAVPRAREGRLTRMRASLVNTEALARFARENDLVRWVKFGRGAAVSGDAERPKVLADVVEAIVGAVYLAGGLDAARTLTRRIVRQSIQQAAIAKRDPKSELQERVQRHGHDAPEYVVLDVLGPEHEQVFQVEVRAGGNVLGHGRGRSKKLAEQRAAHDALSALEREQNEQT